MREQQDQIAFRGTPPGVIHVPPPGYVAIFAGTDGLFYTITSTGTIAPLAGSTGPALTLLDPPVLSTQTAAPVGNVDFLFAALSIPADVRLVLGVLHIYVGTDPGEAIYVQTVTSTYSQFIAGTPADAYGTIVCATPAAFFPAYGTDRLRFGVTGSSAPVSVLDSISFRAFGYIA